MIYASGPRLIFEHCKEEGGRRPNRGRCWLAAGFTDLFAGFFAQVAKFLLLRVHVVASCRRSRQRSARDIGLDLSVTCRQFLG